MAMERALPAGATIREAALPGHQSLASPAVGLYLAGVDPVAGVPRLTFGRVELLDGIDIVPIAMGMFGIAEILLNVGARAQPVFETKLRDLWLTMDDVRRSGAPILRGTGLGFFIGLIPGMNLIFSTVVSDAVEKRMSRTPEKFGSGMIEGVASSETANNAHAVAALIPLLTLGIPASPSIALIAAAFMMNGLIPGPILFSQHADFVWTVVASLYIVNAALLILNLPLIPMWVAVLKLPYSVLFSVILALTVVGSYSLRNSVFDVGLMLAFGLLGYAFKKLDIQPAPFILTVVLGPLMERGLRQSLELSGGDSTIFLTRPICASLLLLAVAINVLSGLGIIRQTRSGNAGACWPSGWVSSEGPRPRGSLAEAQDLPCTRRELAQGIRRAGRRGERLEVAEEAA